MHIDPHCINPPESATPIELDDAARALRELPLVAQFGGGLWAPCRGDFPSRPSRRLCRLSCGLNCGRIAAEAAPSPNALRLLANEAASMPATRKQASASPLHAMAYLVDFLDKWRTREDSNL